MRKNNNKGFTFVELILYMAILGIFMVAVVNLIGSAVATNKKQKSRQKLQTQATEVYDTISDMLMGAMDVKIYGDAYLSGESSTVTGSFVPYDSSTMSGKDSGTKAINTKSINGSPIALTQTVRKSSGAKSEPSGWVSSSYDVADVTQFVMTATSTSGGSVSDDPKADIYTTYLWIQYCSDLVEDTSVLADDPGRYKDKITSATIKYDETAKRLYLVRTADYTSAEYAADTTGKYTSYIDDGGEKGTLLAKNVSGFTLQVNAENNSVAIIIDLEDEQTGQTYEVTGVVGLRNSYVLKEHEWN